MFLKTHAKEIRQYQVIQKKGSSISQCEGKFPVINIISVIVMLIFYIVRLQEYIQKFGEYKIGKASPRQGKDIKQPTGIPRAKTINLIKSDKFYTL